ncbi:transcriptional regulator, TetR family protein [Plesiocystis pacifica SIR-1]|uniref:Transcriptional regulator, TetR family protein n=1 Tax=Plesiocystis pacifica SIR-1 TaxID=391625 RepID=A6GE02_9BACT|nr:TetR/AcrR family transcriptional regulator [Plesiocystis pacifica]EDM75868.1 transcriptional regulator, TetR family protein [Plesiocystis pacifica SIR-1]
MGKGHDTRRAILSQALDLSTEIGLEGLSIGVIAKQVGMSKSGLYAHFDSKEDLQCQVLDAAAESFRLNVVLPAIKKPRGLPRVEAMFELWLEWSTTAMRGGCPFVAAAADFDDRPGVVRQRLVMHLEDLRQTLVRAAEIAVEVSHFRADLDTRQLAFETWAFVLAFHQYQRLMGIEASPRRAKRAFERLIRDAQGPSPR